MSDRPPMKKTTSGNHPAVLAMRAKMESIAEHTIPLIEQANAALDAAISVAPGPNGEKPLAGLPGAAPVPSFDDDETPVPKTPSDAPHGSHVKSIDVSIHIEVESDPFSEK